MLLVQRLIGVEVGFFSVPYNAKEITENKVREPAQRCLHAEKGPGVCVMGNWFAAVKKKAALVLEDFL